MSEEYKIDYSKIDEKIEGPVADETENAKDYIQGFFEAGDEVTFIGYKVNSFDLPNETILKRGDTGKIVSVRLASQYGPDYWVVMDATGYKFAFYNGELLLT
jgi:hypothetical protein